MPCYENAYPTRATTGYAPKTAAAKEPEHYRVEGVELPRLHPRYCPE